MWVSCVWAVPWLLTVPLLLRSTGLRAGIAFDEDELRFDCFRRR